MKKILGLSLISLTLLSCAKFIGITDEEAFEEKVVTESGKTSVKVHFSHNINGELYPCGCRHFPLGGLPQIAGAMTKSRNTSYVVYVDSGDTLFPSTVVPDSMKKSLIYTADNLVQGLDSLGLKFFTPGDQDFALGEDYLAEISQKAKFIFLMANLSEHSKIKHKKWAKVTLPNLNLYFIGVVDPSIYPASVQHLFSNPEEAIKSSLNEISPSAKDRVILMSHSGMEMDTKFAEKFPRLNWIIGAHTQNFLREPNLQGETKIAQVLSKNHYLGDIEFDLGNLDERYSIVEIRDELKDELKPNPFTDFLDQHRVGLRDIQSKEQSVLLSANPEQRSVTANNCFQCHKEQNTFWQKTSHALAFGTLLKAKEEHNPQCVGCHTLKFQDPTGFSKFEDIVVFKEQESSKESYWKQYLGYFSKVPSVRNATPASRAEIAKKIHQLDEKMHVSHNFTGVQCLNCHDKSNLHPFDNVKAKSKEARKNDIKIHCMNCHTPDQSPEWYISKNKKQTLNETYFDQKYKTMSCPKRKEYE